MKRFPDFEVTHQVDQPGSDQPASPFSSHLPEPEPQGVTVIVTTDPEPFRARFTAELGVAVHVFDNSTAALDAINSLDCERLFVDFRQLRDGWSGLRLLRRVRADPAQAHVEVFLMAGEWQAAQEVSAIQAGGAGLVHRNPNAIAKQMAAPASRGTRPEPWKQSPKVDTAPTQGQDPTLASSPPVNEAWADAVHAIFKSYAGALGARLMIAATAAASEGFSRMSRIEYANDLTARLATPERRSEFAAALRAAGLIHKTRNR